MSAVVAGALSLTTARTIVLSQPNGHKVLHALKRPDRSKQCHCLQFAKCISRLVLKVSDVKVMSICTTFKVLIKFSYSFIFGV